MKQTFYSNGKLLITGEYVVLDGAKAFALPTRFGQNLIVENGQNQQIDWKSYDSDGSIWFESTITFEAIRNKQSFEGDKIKSTLVEILHHALLLNPKFLEKKDGYTITTTLTFPKFWGLGTSSTLINNIAQWLEINAFTLLKNSFGGSGYDIACAQHCTPIIYQLVEEQPVVTPVVFHPEFTNTIYFVYLNKKQNSKEAIANYFNRRGDLYKTIPVINILTNEVVSAKDINTFALALQKHEIEMNNLLETQTIKEALFHDFNGTIKSLGAWGGDFILAVSKENPTDYFKSKGYSTVIPYEEMIL